MSPEYHVQSEGGWWCCCKACVIFSDNFDRLDEAGNPALITTQELGTAWDTADASGEWWIWLTTLDDPYIWDLTLKEVSGTGELLCKVGWPGELGYAAFFTTVDELDGSVYRILLCSSSDKADCLIAEFGVGNPWDTSPYLKLIQRVGGVESVLKTQPVYITGAEHYLGRVFIAVWISDGGMFCASIGGNDAGTLAKITQLGVFPTATERKAGVANASGSGEGGPIPMQYNDFGYLRMYANASTGQLQIEPCIYCNCKCEEWSGGQLLVTSLFPLTMYLHVVSAGATDPMPPFTVYPPIDEWVAMVWIPDIDAVMSASGTWTIQTPNEGWIGSGAVCGVTYIFRCTVLEVWWLNESGVWNQAGSVPIDPVTDLASWHCNPIEIIWNHGDYVVPFPRVPSIFLARSFEFTLQAAAPPS